MRLDPFSERVLTAMRDRLPISASDAERARSLAFAGLTLEQAAFALGLATPETYDECLGFASGLPVAHRPRFLEDVLDAETLGRHHALPFARQYATVAVAFRRPLPEALDAVREALAARELDLQPYVAADSAWWKADVERERAVGMLRRLRQAAAKARTRQLRLMHFHTDRGEEVALTADGMRRLPAREISPHALPALAYRIRRLGVSTGWQADVWHTGLTTALHVSLAGSSVEHDHPAGWSALEAEFRKRPRGLTVIMANDPSFARDAFRRYKGRADAVPADTTDEQEAALHAALSGKAVTAWTSDESGWWRPAASAGVRVRVLVARPGPHGFAWSSYLERV